MRFGFLDPFPRNPFAPGRILFMSLMAAMAGYVFAGGLDPHRHAAWGLAGAGVAALIYALGAVGARARLGWLEGQGEGGWQQNLKRRRASTQLAGAGFLAMTIVAMTFFPTSGRPMLTFLTYCLALSTLVNLLEGSTELERLLVRQRDLAIQARLAPHFLHGALSTLKGAIAEDPLEAQALVDQLARLSREAMAITAEREIPLTRELAFVEAYLGVERARRGEALQVVIEVPEGLESEPVPPMSLQLLVENALRHGLPTGGGEIRILASRPPEGLQLCVEDPGQGDGSTLGTGQSLGILRRRLERTSDLDLAPTSEGRHRATLLLRRA
jgi:hypothetical protein